MTIMLRRIACIALAATAAGCSTPKAALDQPNHAAMLTVSLEKELRELRAVQSAFAQSRVAAIRSLEAQLATYEVETGFDLRAKRLAGNDKEARLIADLIELADSKAADDASLKARLAALDADLAKLVSPVPEMSAKLKATQVALAALGQELSLKERAKLASDFSSDLRDQIKKAKEDAKADPKAESAVAASAPTP